MANLSNINNKFLVTAGGNVGINSTGPNEKLEVGGSIRIDNGASFTSYQVYRDNIKYGDVGGGGNQFTIQASNNKNINLFDDSGVGLTVKDGGNVGIGTTTPNTALQVNQNTTVPLLVHRPSNTNFDPHGIGFSTRSDALNGGLGDVRSGIFSDYNGDLFLAAATSSITTSPLTYSRLFIEGGNGHVGIGTTSPIEKLNIVETTTTAGTFFPVAISGARYQSDYGVGIAFRPETNSSGYANKTAIVASGGGYGYNQADLHFCLNQSNTVTDEVNLSDTRMIIKKSGNVGIGTTSLTNSSGYNTLSISGTTGAQIAFQTSGAGKHYIYSTATDFDIYNGQAGNLKLYTNSTERMRITGGTGAGESSTMINYINSNIETYGSGAYSGKLIVKAHTTTPNTAITCLNGNVGGDNPVFINFVNEFVSNQYNYLARIAAAPENTWTGTASTRNSSLNFYTNSAGASAERMRITSAGDVLIHGTYNPYSQGNRGNITLNGSNSNIIAFTNNSSSKAYIYHNGLDFEITNGVAGILKFATNSTERMRIDGSGDVAIQTSGADDIKNFTINSSNGSSQVAGFVIQNDGANGYIHFKAGAGNATPTTKLTIGNAANSGNVGIGTTLPGATLDVDDDNTGKLRLLRNGSVRAEFSNNANEGELSLYRSNNSKYVYLSSYYNCYIDPQQGSAVVGIGGAGVGIFGSGQGGNTTLDVQGPLRNKRVMRGWYHCGPITSTDAYRHIKTNLWMGGSPAGNTEYIMGGFEAKGYAYFGSYPGFGHGTCMFHNWSGSFASLQVANYGTAGFMQSPYVSTDGYCVIVLRHNTYMQPAIDFSQYYTPYPWRTAYVTAETTSPNTTGVY